MKVPASWSVVLRQGPRVVGGYGEVPGGVLCAPATEGGTFRQDSTRPDSGMAGIMDKICKIQMRSESHI